MLEQLTLTNFRQHRSLAVNLTPGLNVIRGANEVGKSTLLEALAYAFYGARSLREPLEDTVTWGETASSLKVEMKFTFDGVPGFVRRSKSGAEAKYGETLVSGQSEVTGFFERLFGVTAKMAGNLQIASQNKVRGAVEGGAAVSLIESLADFSLLETIVEKVQTLRPCGNTNIVADRLQRLKDAQATPIPPEPDRLDIERPEGHLRTLLGTLQGLQTDRDLLRSLTAPAKALIQTAEVVESRRAAAALRKSTVVQELAKPLPELTGTAEDVSNWRAKQEAEQQRERLLTAYQTKEPECRHVWDGTRDSFTKALAEVKERVKSLRERSADLRVQYAGKLAMRINEKACAFCKKDLQDVPEVSWANAAVDVALADIKASQESCTTALSSAEKELEAMEAIAKADAVYPGRFPTALWDMDFATIPPKINWKGAVPSTDPDRTDYAGLLRSAEASVKERAKAEGTRATLQAELTRLEADISAAAVDTKEAQATLERYEAQQAAVTRVEMEVANTKSTIKLAEQAYEHAVVVRQQALAAAEAAKREVEATTKELADMAFYNELIRKVRAARPAVANKLWALVMAAVSHYTTMGRGTPSTVTRDGDGFKINGKGVDAYSGSAQDVLGMAVRLALVKTFLPSSPFMIMDEIAAACDDDRELDMLGMVLAADIPQVLLVTHSDAAESFAANLVQI